MPHETIIQEGETVTEQTVIETPAAETSTITVTAEASLLEEYVASGDGLYRPWDNQRYLRQLPIPTDELVRDFGSSIYERDMPVDPQVYSTMSILVMAILAQGVRLTPPVEKDDPDYEAARTVLALNQYCIDNLKHPVTELLYELVDGALKMGHKTGELIYEQRDWTAGEQNIAQAMLLVDIKTKPHEATAFVVDAYNNELGIMYVRPGRPLPRLGPRGRATGGSLLTPEEVSGEDEDGMPIMVPRAKFLIPKHKPRNGDPRGTSHLRSVYKNYWKKQQVEPQHMAYIARFAQPSAIANIGKDAKDIPIMDAEGNLSGKKSIVTATKEALSKVKSGAVGAFVDTVVALLEAEGEAKVLFDTFSHEDRQMAKAILMQTLTTEESQYMARAASAVHQDVFGLLISYLRTVFQDAIKREVLYWITRLNFGQEVAERLTPNITLGAVQVQDIPKVMASVAQIALAKGINRTQWPKLHADWGLPGASEEEWERQWKQEDEAIEMAKQAALQPPGGVGGGGRGEPEDGQDGPRSDGRERPSREGE